MGRAVQCLFMLALITISMQSAHAQQASVRSELSSSTITRDETVVLTVTAVGVDAELDASALDKDFDVLGRSSSREIRTISDANNRIVTTSVVTWALELMPRNTGIFSVPSVKVGDMSTQLLTLTVNDVPQGAKRDIFVEASLDTQEPWVQSQVIMTVSVFQAIEIVDGGLDAPSGANLVVERVGEDTRSRQVRDGREYTVTERRFALFPQKSGVLEIDPVTLSVTVPADANRVRGFFSPTRKLTRRTLPMRMNVRQRPDGSNAWWLPASAVQLQSQWVTPPDEARVDTPLTRTITLRVEGVQDAQLPDIPVPAIDGISLYSEEPQRAMGASSRGLVAEQKINWALIPQRSGTIVLPEIRIEWFNTSTGLTETALLPEETITIPANGAEASLSNTDNTTAESPASASISDSTDFQELDSAALQGSGLSDSQTSQLASGAPDTGGVDRAMANISIDTLVQRVDTLETSAGRWRLLAIAAVLLWILSVALLLWKKQQISTQANSLLGHLTGKRLSDSGADLYKRVAPYAGLETACKGEHAGPIKQALLEWARWRWPQTPPATLAEIASRLPDGVAREKILELDRLIYGQSGLNESAFMAQISSLPGDLKSAFDNNTGALSEKAAATRPRNGLPSL